MKNTIMPKSRMIGLRFSYWFNKPKRGQIIIFRNPDDTSKLFVKRIIGEPGDIVEIKQGETFVNNELLDEPYLDKSPRRLNYGPYEVPDKCYFVLGDNRNRSNDSRRWTNKYVPEKYILAKAVLCYWPTKYAGRIK